MGRRAVARCLHFGNAERLATTAKGRLLKYVLAEMQSVTTLRYLRGASSHRYFCALTQAF